MKPHRPVIVALTLLVLGSFCIEAAAENRDGSVSVTPMVGGHHFEGDQNLDDDFTYGLSLGYNFSPQWAVEGVVNYTDSEGRRGRSGADVYIYRLEALYHLMPEKALVPFLALGAGGITYDGNGGNDDDFLFDYGLGLKWFFQEDLALRGDVRHLYAFDDPDHNLIYTVGLTWQIGGARAQAPPTVREQPPEAAAPSDSDQDGVPDHLDRCPDTRKGEYVDEQGCTLKLTLHINFDFDKAQIKPEFVPDLERAARFIKEHQEVPKILIEGHTDSVGEPSYNMGLSMRRASAIRQYLIDNFSIAPDRLVARGVGENQPVASNETEEGRYENRRVEIICCIVIPPEQ